MHALEARDANGDRVVLVRADRKLVAKHTESGFYEKKLDAFSVPKTEWKSLRSKLGDPCPVCPACPVWTEQIQRLADECYGPRRGATWPGFTEAVKKRNAAWCGDGWVAIPNPVLGAVQHAVVLGIPWPSTWEAICVAHRAATLRYHPDREGGNLEMMIKVNAARDALKQEVCA